MGGSLLKDCTRRHTIDEYFHKTSQLLLKFNLGSEFQFHRMKLIPAYKTKTSFGDADIVYCTKTGKPFDTEIIQKALNSKRVLRNGEVTSFEYNELQIDLILTNASYYDYALSYFSWNDCGNFVGKLARYFGLSHGHKGLYLPIRDNNTNVIDSILVSTDHSETLKFVGLDPAVFDRGFETMEDVYRFIQSSPYFNPESYALENISSIGRMRDKKRESYRNFLKFNESYTGPKVNKVLDKSIFLPKIFETFPGTEEKFESVMRNVVFKRELKSKFNGEWVNTVTGLSGKELGEFMKVLRKQPMFSPAILTYLPQHKIVENILNIFRGYQNV